MTTPRIGAPELVEGQATPETTVNEIVRYLEAGANFFNLVALGTTTPPGSPSDGHVYVVGAAATGVWSGYAAGSIALYIESSWVEIAALDGFFAYNRTDDRLYKNDGSGGLAAWVLYRAQGESLIVAVSDETTDLTTGNAKLTFRMPYAFTLTSIKASAGTAPTGSPMIVDINENGSTILSTKLSIDAGEKTSTTAASAAVISDSELADDAEITIDIDQVGATIPGAGLKVYLIGVRS